MLLRTSCNNDFLKVTAVPACFSLDALFTSVATALGETETVPSNKEQLAASKIRDDVFI
jgi:hypothetical protein